MCNVYEPRRQQAESFIFTLYHLMFRYKVKIKDCVLGAFTFTFVFGKRITEEQRTLLGKPVINGGEVKDKYP